MTNLYSFEYILNMDSVFANRIASIMMNYYYYYLKDSIGLGIRLQSTNKDTMRSNSMYLTMSLVYFTYNFFYVIQKIRKK